METLGDALLELKSLRAELVRLQELRDSSFKKKIYRLKDGTTSAELPKWEITVEAVNLEINKLISKIRKLKIRVENTNHTTFVDTPEGKMSIAEAIHYVADMRSELACMQRMKESYKNTDDGYSLRSDPSEYVFQIPHQDFLKWINTLEAKKVKMDAFLSSYNWKMELLP